MTPFELYGCIGGVTIALSSIFAGYRYIVGQAREDRKFMEDRLTNLIEDYNAASDKHSDVLVENTKVLSELYTYLKLKNGNR